MEGKKQQASQTGDDPQLYEATAGWDSYVSGLVAEQHRDIKAAGRPSSAAQQERRRKPRDRTPSGRRALLLSGQADTQTEDE